MTNISLSTCIVCTILTCIAPRSMQSHTAPEQQMIRKNYITSWQQKYEKTAAASLTTTSRFPLQLRKIRGSRETICWKKRKERNSYPTTLCLTSMEHLQVRSELLSFQLTQLTKLSETEEAIFQRHSYTESQIDPFVHLGVLDFQ